MSHFSNPLLGMDEINILLLALVLAILIRRIFEPNCNSMDILWLPLLTFVIYWILLRLYTEQNPELRNLWRKIFVNPPHSFENFQDAAEDALNRTLNNTTPPPDKSPQELSKDALLNLTKIEEADDLRLSQSASLIGELFDRSSTEMKEPSPDDVKKFYQDNHQLSLNDETADLISRSIVDLMGDNLPKGDNEYAAAVFRQLKVVEKTQETPTAPTPLEYTTPPTSTSFSSVGPATPDPNAPTPVERPPNNIGEEIAQMDSPLLRSPPQETPHENEPLAVLADYVMKSMPSPLPGVDAPAVNVYLHGCENQSSSPIKQNFYFMKDGRFQQSLNDKGVAPTTTSMTFNGPLSADATWAFNRGQETIPRIQNRSGEMRREREIMGTNGIPNMERIVGGIREFRQAMEAVDGFENNRFGTYPEVKKLTRVPKDIYADESGGERMIRSQEWESQFDALLPPGKFRNEESAQKACFPSGVIQTSAWKEWKEVVQKDDE